MIGDSNQVDYGKIQTREAIVYTGSICMVIGLLMGSLLVKSEIPKPKPLTTEQINSVNCN